MAERDAPGGSRTEPKKTRSGRDDLTELTAFFATIPGRYEEHLPGVPGEDVLFFTRLNVLKQVLEGFQGRALRSFGLADSEYRVLAFLRVHEEGFRVTPIDLNRIIRLTSAGITKALDRLEDAGHIERTPNPADRRSILVGLTEQGRALAEAACRTMAEQYSNALAGWTEKQRDQHGESVRAMIHALTERPGS